MRPARLVRRVVVQAGIVLVHRLEQFGVVTLEQPPSQPCRDIGSHVAGKEMVEQRRKFLARLTGKQAARDTILLTTFPKENQKTKGKGQKSKGRSREEIRSPTDNALFSLV